MREAVTLLLVALMLGACGGPLKYTVQSSGAAPGADADLVAEVNEGQNQTQLEVTITNLIPPDRVKEGLTAYTAWYRKDSAAQWARIGGVDYDADNRSGKLVGSVPEKAFDFSITGEANDAPASPSASVIFSQRVAE